MLFLYFISILMFFLENTALQEWKKKRRSSVNGPSVQLKNYYCGNWMHMCNFQCANNTKKNVFLNKIGIRNRMHVFLFSLVMLNINVLYRSNILKAENVFLFSHSFGIFINISKYCYFIHSFSDSISCCLIMQIIHDEWRTYLPKTRYINKTEYRFKQKTAQFRCANCVKWMNELNWIQEHQQQYMVIKLNVNKMKNWSMHALAQIKLNIYENNFTYFFFFFYISLCVLNLL